MIIENITLPVILNTVLPKGTKIAVKEATLTPNWFNMKEPNRITIYMTDTNDPNPTIIDYLEGFYSLADLKNMTNANSKNGLWIDLTVQGSIRFKIPEGYLVHVTDELKTMLGLPNMRMFSGATSFYGRHTLNELDRATLHLDHLQRSHYVRNDTQLDQFHYFHLGTSYKWGDSLHFWIENPVFHTLTSSTDTLRLTLRLPDGTDVSSSLKHLQLIIKA